MLEWLEFYYFAIKHFLRCVTSKVAFCKFLRYISRKPANAICKSIIFCYHIKNYHFILRIEFHLTYYIVWKFNCRCVRSLYSAGKLRYML